MAKKKSAGKILKKREMQEWQGIVRKNKKELSFLVDGEKGKNKREKGKLKK